MSERPRWIVTRTTIKEAFAAGATIDFINANTVSLHGRPIEVDDGDTTDWTDAVLICAPPDPPIGAHRRVAACDDCASPIVYMATAPKTAKRICLRCARKQGAFD